MANHKRGKPKSGRSGCLMCKPHKHQALKKSDRQRDRREAFRHEERSHA